MSEKGKRNNLTDRNPDTVDTVNGQMRDTDKQMDRLIHTDRMSESVTDESAGAGGRRTRKE